MEGTSLHDMSLATHLFALGLHHPLVLRPLLPPLLLPGGPLLADAPQPLGQQVAPEGLELGRVQDVQHVRRKVLTDLQAKEHTYKIQVTMQFICLLVEGSPYNRFAKSKMSGVLTPLALGHNL